MGLILLFISILFNFSREDKKCKIIGKETENSGYAFNNNNYCSYLDTNEFNAFEEVILDIYVHSGHFNEDFMYYGETFIEPIKDSYVTLTKTQVNFDYHDCSKCYSNYFSYFFKKPKITQRYLIMSCPSFKGIDCGIDITTRLSPLSIALIVIGAIVFISGIIILIVFLIKRKKKKKLLLLPTKDYPSTINESTITENSKPTSANDKTSFENNYPPPPVNESAPGITDYPSPD